MTYNEAEIEARDNQQAIRRASWNSNTYIVYVPERTTAFVWVGYIKKFFGNLPITIKEHFLKADTKAFEVYNPTDDDKNATDWELYTKKPCNDKVPDMSIPKTVFCEV